MSTGFEILGNERQGNFFTKRFGRSGNCVIERPGNGPLDPLKKLDLDIAGVENTRGFPGPA